MRVEECIGWQVREHRAKLGMRAVEFGARLGKLTGKPWSRQAVSAAEQGKRAFPAAELIAIAKVLDTNVTRLLMPPPGVGEYVMPSGVTVEARPLLVSGATTSPVSEAMSEALRRLQEAGVRMREDGDRLATLAYDLDSALLR